MDYDRRWKQWPAEEISGFAWAESKVTMADFCTSLEDF